MSGPTSVPAVARIADPDAGVGRARARRAGRRRRSRGRSAGAATCSAGRPCRRPRRRWPARPGRGRPCGATIMRVVAAELEQRARRSAPRRAARSRGPSRVEPVARDERHARIVDQHLAASRPPTTISSSPSGRVAEARGRALEDRLGTASAVSGVFSDGFHTTRSPQTSASAKFHAHTATGKLNAVITPTTPSGCQVSHHPVARSLRRDREAVELARQADREVADVDHLLDLAERLRQRSCRPRA